MKQTTIAGVLFAAFAAPALAQTAAPAAVEPAPAPTPALTANIGLVSDYVFRGLTQTNGKPAIQGGIDYAHSSGFYVGTWLSNISWFTDQNAGTRSTDSGNIGPISLASPGAVGAPYLPNQSNQASLEWDFYGGYKGSFAGDWTYDIGLLRYQYPGSYDNLGAYRNPNTTEVYGALGYKWLTLKYSKGISATTFGVNDSKGADYLDLSAAVPLGDSGVNLLAHVGHQRYPSHSNVGYWGASGGNNGFFTYTDYKLGVTKEYSGFTFGLAYTYADTKDTAPDNQTTTYLNTFGKNTGRGRGVVSVSRTF